MSTTRHTPRVDALLADLAEVLEERGARSRLAEMIAQEADITLQSARTRVTRITQRETLPNGEDTLLIADFIAARQRRRR